MSLGAHQPVIALATVQLVLLEPSTQTRLRDQDAHEFLEYLDRRVNLELDEWAQPVNVGAFSDTTIRKMAIECDLKRIYDLSFAPMSSENHGEWPSVRDTT